MRKPTTRTARLLGFAAAPAAILVAGVLVWGGSNAAFTASTANPGANWSAGAVALSDDDLGVAAFSAANIVPGQTGQKCIVVTSKSSVPGIVKVYAKNLVPSLKGFEDRVTLTLESGAGGTFNDCAGFIATAGVTPTAQSLTTMAAASKDFATGSLAWSTAGVTAGESKTYRGTWKFDVTGLTQTEVNALQGARTGIDLVWELQSN